MKKYLKDSILLFFACAMAFFLVYRRETPIPFLVNWDLLHHTTLVKQLLEGNFSLSLMAISDTFTVNSYTPLFHLIIALPAVLFKTDVLGLFWIAEFFHYLFTTAVAYYIGKKLIHSPQGGLVTAFISLLVFESTAAYTTLFLLPLTLSGTLAALFATHFITHKKINPVRVFVTALIVFALHYMIGALYLGLLSLIYVSRKAQSGRLNLSIFAALSFFALTGVILNLTGQKIPLLDRPDAQYFVYTIPALWALFGQWYGFLPIPFMILGLVYFGKNHDTGWKFLMVFLSISALILFPMSYGLKFFAVNHYFMAVLLAAGIIKALSVFDKRWVKIGLLSLICAAMAGVFVTNMNEHLRLSFNGKHNSYISESDIRAARWIDSHYGGKRVFMVSDPTTQGTFEAISTVNTQGGAFPRHETVVLLDSMRTESDPKKISDAFMGVHDALPSQDERDVTLLALGGRYFAWQQFDWECKTSYACQSWLPLKIKASDKKYLENISSSIYMKLVYSDSETAIFELNSQPNSI